MRTYYFIAVFASVCLVGGIASIWFEDGNGTRKSAIHAEGGGEIRVKSAQGTATSVGSEETLPRVLADGASVIVDFSTVSVEAEIADEPDEQQRGLSGRTGLAPGHGMLFVYDRPAVSGFWMPDMHFSIDIIWFDETMRVITVKEHATPESYPEVFKPARPARYVLEVPAGFARMHSIEPGTRATVRSVQTPE